ncbi:MAG: GspH/FimT family pseudopilin [Neisseriaceae bacterium]|nr:GspH/FimT family pseudopilin [Neisseriaceae bacterium]
MNHNRSNQGFTLIELMIVVALVAIFTTLAVPSMGNMIARQRVNAAANDFANTLVFTQNEAIRQSRSVFIVPGKLKSDGKLHGMADKAVGWTGEDKTPRTMVVFSDNNKVNDSDKKINNQKYDTEEDLRVTQFNPNLSFKVEAYPVGGKRGTDAVADYGQQVGFVYSTNGQMRMKKEFDKPGGGKLGLIGRIVIADKRQAKSLPGSFCRVVRVESISRATTCTPRETMLAVKDKVSGSENFCYCDKDDM